MDIASLDLASVDHVLTTTRAVRKRLDLTRPVEPVILEKCLEIALQAPIGLSGETRHFMVVTEPEPRAAIAALYRQAAAEARSGTRPGDPYLAKLQITDAADSRFTQQQRMFASGAHLVHHLHEVPVLVLACIEGRVEHAGSGAQASLYASIMPTVWSLMLALRARGIGSVLTTRHIHLLSGRSPRSWAYPRRSRRQRCSRWRTLPEPTLNLPGVLPSKSTRTGITGDRCGSRQEPPGIWVQVVHPERQGLPNTPVELRPTFGIVSLRCPSQLRAVDQAILTLLTWEGSVDGDNPSTHGRRPRRLASLAAHADD
jgi:nitroreductase